MTEGLSLRRSPNYRNAVQKNRDGDHCARYRSLPSLAVFGRQRRKETAQNVRPYVLCSWSTYTVVYMAFVIVLWLCFAVASAQQRLEAEDNIGMDMIFYMSTQILRHCCCCCCLVYY